MQKKLGQNNITLKKRATSPLLTSQIQALQPWAHTSVQITLAGICGYKVALGNNNGQGEVQAEFLANVSIHSFSKRRKPQGLFKHTKLKKKKNLEETSGLKTHIYFGKKLWVFRTDQKLQFYSLSLLYCWAHFLFYSWSEILFLKQFEVLVDRFGPKRHRGKKSD